MSPLADPLADPKVRAVLDREHGRARGDEDKLARVRPLIEAAKRGGGGYAHLYPKDAYLAVAPDMGRFLALAALAVGARSIVEFGSSFGISTLYLAAAARALGGSVLGSEYEPGKVARARASLAEAGLGDHAEIRVGDALETLANIAAPVDLLFLDGWKELYLPVLELIEPKLRPGALVLADNLHTFPEDLAPYLAYVSRPDAPYATVVLPFESGLGYSLYRG